MLLIACKNIRKGKHFFMINYMKWVENCDNFPENAFASSETQPPPIIEK